MTPTVGRIVYFYTQDPTIAALGPLPFKADVVYVHEDGKINLVVSDHLGNEHNRQGVTLVPDGEATDLPEYAFWMPYQVQAAKRDKPLQEAESEAKSNADDAKFQRASDDAKLVESEKSKAAAEAAKKDSETKTPPPAPAGIAGSTPPPGKPAVK